MVSSSQAMSGTAIADLQLPAPNMFIPEKLDVEKFDVKEVCLFVRLR